MADLPELGMGMAGGRASDGDDGSHLGIAEACQENARADHAGGPKEDNVHGGMLCASRPACSAARVPGRAGARPLDSSAPPCTGRSMPDELRERLQAALGPP